MKFLLLSYRVRQREGIRKGSVRIRKVVVDRKDSAEDREHSAVGHIPGEVGDIHMRSAEADPGTAVPGGPVHPRKAVAGSSGNPVEPEVVEGL